MWIQTDGIGAKYDEAIDRESAEEILNAKAGEAAAAAAEAKAQTEAAKAAAVQAKLDAQEQWLAQARGNLDEFGG